MRRPRILTAAFILVAGLAGSLVLLSIGVSAGAGQFFVALLMAVAPVPFYLAIASWVDRFEPEPWRLLAKTFLWGATIAVLFAAIFNGIGEGVFMALAGSARAATLTAVLAAPVIEELAKGAALLILFVWWRDEFDNVTDGIMYAAMVGLGFAMTENVQYYAKALASPDGAGPTLVFFMRGVLSPFSHPLYASMTGIGLGLARESDRRSVKVLAPLCGLATAMLLHAIWNLGASLGLVFFATYLFIMVPAFIGVIAVVVFSLRREARIIRAHLEGVVAHHLLSADDIIVVTSVRKRIAASARALTEGGFRKWRDRRRFHALATELAFHAWRASRGATERDAAIHQELAAEIHDARAKLGLPVGAPSLASS